MKGLGEDDTARAAETAGQTYTGQSPLPPAAVTTAQLIPPVPGGPPAAPSAHTPPAPPMPTHQPVKTVDTPPAEGVGQPPES